MAANVVSYVEQFTTVQTADVSNKLDNIVNLLSLQNGNTRAGTTSSGILPTQINWSKRAQLAKKRRQIIGMDKDTGRLLSGIEHLKQSITDILITSVGSRVMRRKYGSNLFEKIDSPVGSVLRVGIITDIAEALDKWEPRFILKQVHISTTKTDLADGKLRYGLKGTYINGDISLDLIV